jgi:hypothetical protein
MSRSFITLATALSIASLPPPSHISLIGPKPCNIPMSLPLSAAMPTPATKLRCRCPVPFLYRGDGRPGPNEKRKWLLLDSGPGYGAVTITQSVCADCADR